MEVGEFVSETLTGIVIGIQEAKLNVAELGAIAPGSINGKAQKIERTVHFEIAVTASEAKVSEKSASGDVKGRARVVVVSAEVDGEVALKAKSDQLTQRVSRISFDVPISLNQHFRVNMKENPGIWKEDREALKRAKSKNRSEE
tara:strand:+ start:1618 stop:2049 length:432 start_codon:yes stop_codon:yes gene_type:complete